MDAFDISSLVAAETPEARKAAVSTFAKRVKSAGVVKFKESGAIDKLRAELSDKGKTKTNNRLGALAAFAAVVEQLGQQAEPIILPLFGELIEATADKMKPVSVAADELVKSITKSLPSNAVKFVLTWIMMDQNGKWQSNLCRAELFSSLAEHHPVQVGRCLNEIIPVITSLMWDTKAQVKQASLDAISKAFNTVHNKDIAGFLPEIIECIQKPELVQECIHKLAGVVFVQEIDGSALSIMVPLLKRGFDDPTTSIKRNTARIVENMAKLVDDPYEVAAFVPLLLPALERAKEEVSDPECRTVCGKAHDQLKSTANKPPVWKRIDLASVEENVKEQTGSIDQAILRYIASLSLSMLDLKNLNPADWYASLSPYLQAIFDAAKTKQIVSSLLDVCSKAVQIEEEKEEADDAELLCDCQFSLAYGNKVLLNQTHLKLKRGYRYSLCGKNDSGKTSLMRAIANQQVEGFPPPEELRTMFVETDVQGDLSEMSVIDFVVHHPGLKQYGITYDMAREKLMSVGFAENDDGMAPASLTKQVGRLSGGWRMKLALCRAMLMKADILLLDEPTNHLDPGNVKWVCDYLTSLSGVTSIIVSHDIKVLDQVCTHTLQIDNLKLKLFKGNLTEVATKFVPELMSYFELKASKFTMNFPKPGNLEGITSKGKHIMKMTNITFTYPGAPRAQLERVTVRVSLSTRAACIGANGAGKSTMIKLLTGELEPDVGSGDVWKHPNCRVAYVAQHAFHHIEHHLEKTPNEYIRWRYEYGSDKEGLEKVTAKISKEEEDQMKKPIQIEYTLESGEMRTEKRVFKRFTDGRRQKNKSKENEYEIQWMGDSKSWVAQSKLVQCGFEKLLKQVDERIAALATQLVRPLTQKFVEAHLGDVGLDPEFATHTRIGALSGGQKVKVVLAGAMWNTPHIVILDEPTNYLDRDSLGALADAIKAYDGGVVIISHNAQFVDQVCPEVWHLENHTLNLKGSYDWLESANKEAIKMEKASEEYVDGLGNTVKLEKIKKKPSKADLKKIKKQIAEKRKGGLEVYTDDEIEAAGFLVE